MKEGFYEGLEVVYRGQCGFIYFVSENYITMCIKLGKHKSGDICIVITPERYSEVTLKKQSEK